MSDKIRFRVSACGRVEVMGRCWLGFEWRCRVKVPIWAGRGERGGVSVRGCGRVPRVQLHSVS